VFAKHAVLLRKEPRDEYYEKFFELSMAAIEEALVFQATEPERDLAGLVYNRLFPHFEKYHWGILCSPIQQKGTKTMGITSNLDFVLTNNEEGEADPDLKFYCKFFTEITHKNKEGKKVEK